MYADLFLCIEDNQKTSGLEELLKDEGSTAGWLDVLDTLSQVELFKINSLEKIQGRVTEEPNSAYTTSELSWGIRIPERDNQSKS